MTTPIRAEIARLKALEAAATPGPWLFGEWHILPEDREAQKRREPYWTLQEVEFSGEISAGPIGRKSMDTDRVIWATGYEADGIDGKKVDRDLLLESRNALPSLLAALERCVTALEKISSGQKLTRNGIAPWNQEEYIDAILHDNSAALEAIADATRLIAGEKGEA